MSNSTAIATVTHVLQKLIEAEMPGLSQVPIVSVLSPALVDLAAELPAINIFLYQVTPNPAWRNADLPSHSERGERLTNAPLALDLHYLITAYGKKNLEPEVLLGHAMQALHETPVLTRARITRVLDPNNPSGNPIPDAVKQSDLATQVEQVRISPRALSADDMSKLWSSIQAPYRPSVAYHLSVVLIDRKQPARATLPVLKIGPAREGIPEGPQVVGGLLPPYPSITGLVTPNPERAIRAGETLRIKGAYLARPGIRSTVHFTHQRTHEARDIDVDGTTGELVLALPNDAAWQSGIYAVAVSVRDANNTMRRSGEVPLTMAPSLQFAQQLPATRILDVTISPAVRAGQPVSLLVGTREISGPNVTAPASSLAFTLPAQMFPAGEYIVRVRVDGIDSLILNDVDGVIGLGAAPKVTVP